jgi:hypothetical protein
MSIRVRRPATERLELTREDFLIVKQELTAGETRDLMRASSKPGPGLELDPIAAGVALVVAYLLDWSFTDADGRPLTIADQPATVVRAALDAIDSDAYLEVQQAISDHHAAMAARRAEQKKTPSGSTPSAATSISAA